MKLLLHLKTSTGHIQPTLVEVKKIREDGDKTEYEFFHPYENKKVKGRISSVYLKK